MLSRALENGSGIDVIEKLMSLQERWETNQAKKQYDMAMADMRPDMPEIIKNKGVGYDTKKGDKVGYKHEDLASIVNAISPVMAKYGLTFRWLTETNDKGIITVTCIVSHRDGHSERTSLPGAPDSSGGKNSIQAIGSTVTYLQRYTLKSSLGLSILCRNPRI